MGPQGNRILIIGAYGLIGSAVMRHLLSSGFSVTGLGRSQKKANAVCPDADWIIADLADLTTDADWMPHLEGIDVVVNASGALQDGLKDKLSTTQSDAIIALIEACETAGIKRFIQISAPDARADSATEFYRTKAAADEKLAHSQLEWTLFRPGLVLSPQAYGGTSLLRLLAAFPEIQPIILAETSIRTVDIAELAEAVHLAIRDEVNGDFDLMSSESVTLGDTVAAFRGWLGFPKAKAEIRLPAFLGKLTATVADLAGWFGWRTALRSTSLKVLEDGISGEPEAWTQRTGQSFRTLSATLQNMPSTAQERIYARTMLAFPIALILMSLFWIATGVLSFFRLDQAVGYLGGSVPDGIGALLVIGGACLDIAIGLAMLVRPWTRKACLAAIGLSAAYMVASLFTAPALWLDPLGPLLKIIPIIIGAGLLAAIAEER